MPKATPVGEKAQANEELPHANLLSLNETNQHTHNAGGRDKTKWPPDK